MFWTRCVTPHMDDYSLFSILPANARNLKGIIFIKVYIDFLMWVLVCHLMIISWTVTVAHTYWEEIRVWALHRFWFFCHDWNLDMQDITVLLCHILTNEALSCIIAQSCYREWMVLWCLLSMELRSVLCNNQVF